MELTSSLALNVRSLGFQFESHALFDQWSGQFKPGITWVRGSNGAGKTTLLKLLGGALEPRHGTIQLGEWDSRKNPLDYRRQSFWCGGDMPQLPWLSARELLDITLSLYPAAAPALLHEHLRAFDLWEALAQPVDTLSLGQHKKLLLALALTLPVSLLLLDEPLNALDAQATEHLRLALSDPVRLSSQIVILTSHLDPAIPISETIVLGRG